MKKRLIVLLISTLLIACSLLAEQHDETLSTGDVIEELKRIGLLENATTDELDKHNPNAIVELLIKSEKVIVVDEKLFDAPEAPNHYHPLFDLINGINKDINFDLVSLKLETKEDELGDTSEVITVTIQQDHKLYTSELYYSNNFKIASYYFKVINRVLTDISSDHRLFDVTIFCRDENCETNYFHGNKPVDPNKFGIISLTKEQAEVIQEKDLLPICCNEFDLLKTEKIEQAIEEFKEVGLLDGMTEEEIELRKAEILLERHYSLNGLIYYFDSLVYAFDAETTNFENPYEEITLGLADISKGRFQPTSFIDRYEYNTNSEFSFELNGSKYEIALQNSADWLDLSFIELINSALEEHHIDGQFYTFNGEGQIVTLIFLSKKQFEEIKRKQLLDLLDVDHSTAVEDGQKFEQEVLEKYLEEK